MFMTDVNDVKIYNLSAGKSLPDWLTDRKRKSLLRKNVDLRRRIELIQDFEMPGLSTNIRVSADGQYIIATGTYKPRVKCFEVNNLSLKFERCFDSEVVTFEVLSEDYSKLVFLHCDRHVEFHTAPGRHYRIRIPKFGRDMSYHVPSCDLFIVGTSSEIYRFNLERGQFLQGFETNSNCVNSCEVNPEHHLLCVGTQDGTVEAWDPRDKKKSATLDVAKNITGFKDFPSISTLRFKNGLQMGVGTTTGEVFLYDLRSYEPLIKKNHMNKIPIKKIDFNISQNSVYSMDSAMLKIWDEFSGKQTAFIESSSDFNDFATIPNTGVLFFAQEDTKMQSYYIPSLGPAPRWCSFLDNLTEELESENIQSIYDDYKFITKQELEELGLDDLEGTNLLRAYMHGYFVDIRLYNRAKAASEPFSFEKYRKDKVRQQIETTRSDRLQIKYNLPKVNQEMALKLMEEDEKPKNKKKTSNLLQDSRFKALFEDPDFEVDKNTAEYKMLTPVITRLDKSKIKALQKYNEMNQQELEEKTQENKENSDEELFNEDDDNSSDDDHAWTNEVKKQYKIIKKENARKEKEEQVKEPKMIEIDNDERFDIRTGKSRINKASLGDRVAREENTSIKTIGNSGNRQMNFNIGFKNRDTKQRMFQMKKHKQERRKVVRTSKGLHLKRLPFK